ncbi:MAG: hypothetical protein C0453_15880 [Comamonadaceae bacterium]|nr:hypothetical protein [Comamonadaceae bacterium]
MRILGCVAEVSRWSCIRFHRRPVNWPPLSVIGWLRRPSIVFLNLLSEARKKRSQPFWAGFLAAD